MDDNQTKQVILNLLANELFQTKYPIPRNTDWKQVFEECRRQTVTVHAWKQVSALSGIPEETYEAWKQAAVGAAVNNLHVIWEHAEIGTALQKAGIPYVILKGCASASYYPCPEDRQMGDVDFLVRPEDAERAGRVLEQLSFRKCPNAAQHIHHIAYAREMGEAELHFAVGGIPEGEAGQRIRSFVSDILESSRTIPVEGGSICVPDDFHHGLNLLLHTNQHLLGEGLGLRHLCDWAVFAGRFTEEEFRGLFEEKLRAMGLWRFACIMTAAVVRFLGCPPKKWAGMEDSGKLTEALLEDVFSSGNFGVNQKDRIYASYMIAEPGKRVLSKNSRIVQLFHSLNAAVRRRWPVMNRSPLLLPLGWAGMVIRWLSLISRGERAPLHLGYAFQKAGERRRWYTALKLFEPDPD